MTDWTDWRTLLRAHDPAAEARDTSDRARAIRQVVVNAAAEPRTVASPWAWRLALAGVVLVTLLAGAGDDGRTPVDPGTPAPAAPGGERRQVQFATPGGTRIIWEINPEFTIGETVP